MKIGIIGGGQLSLMMIKENTNKNLNHQILILDPDPNCPSSNLAEKQIIGRYKDLEKIKELAKHTDILTYELEHTSSKKLRLLEKQGYKIFPSPKVLGIVNNKYRQKKFLEKNNISVPEFREVETYEDIIEASREYGFPIMLKRKFNSYDGRGNFLIKSHHDIKAGLQKFENKKKYLEKVINYKKELSIICARDIDKNIVFYPITENIHKNNVLETTTSPARISARIQKRVESIAKRILNLFDTLGVFGIEMFLDHKDNIYINEIAPRVHNTGHHTLDASKTSQFEQHIRAITLMPLGETTTEPAMMYNILGDDNGYEGRYIIQKNKMPKDTKIHIYGKIITKPYRKLGHVTILNPKTKNKEINDLVNIIPYN